MNPKNLARAATSATDASIGSVSNSNLTVDQDYTPLNILSVTRGIVRDELFTQEFCLSGTSFGSRLHWAGGVYFYSEHANSVDQNAAIFGMPPADPFGNNTISTQSYALYGQATYDLTHELALALGLRYTDDEVKLDDAGFPFPPLPTYQQKASYNNKAPMIGLNYQATPDLLLYVKGSQGFRAGGFSPTVASGNPYGEETAKTIEAGARWELSRRLRINPTLFYTRWDDIQFNSIGPCNCFLGLLPFIQNAGNANVRGAELELQAAVTENLTLSGSFSYINSHYTSTAPFLSATNALTQSTPLERAPTTSFSLAPTYTQPLPNGAALSASLSFTWQSKQRSATTDLDNVEISPYGPRWSASRWRSRQIGPLAGGRAGALPGVMLAPKCVPFGSVMPIRLPPRLPSFNGCATSVTLSPTFTVSRFQPSRDKPSTLPPSMLQWLTWPLSSATSISIQVCGLVHWNCVTVPMRTISPTGSNMANE